MNPLPSAAIGAAEAIKKAAPKGFAVATVADAAYCLIQNTHYTAPEVKHGYGRGG